jgi:hypothetical protein
MNISLFNVSQANIQSVFIMHLSLTIFLTTLLNAYKKILPSQVMYYIQFDKVFG